MENKGQAPENHHIMRFSGACFKCGFLRITAEDSLSGIL